jgi:hypothetical protein
MLPADGKSGLRMTRSGSIHENPTSHPNRTSDIHNGTGASSYVSFANCLYP